jgi:2,4-dienoyl-CoA reductase (NADPH2)
VTLFDGADEIGGQFNMAKKVPGKEEFVETLRYFGRQLELHGVDLRLKTRVTADTLIEGGFDEIVLATGVYPRRISLEGIDHPKVLSYIDVLAGGAEVGERVAIIGAGGIGFDVAEYLAHQGRSTALDTDAYMAEWGVDQTFSNRGGLTTPEWPTPARAITLCQRTRGKLGANLGKTTGWIHRSTLKHRAVEMLDMCQYSKIDDDGLHLTVHGQPRVLKVDHVIICAGQVPARDLTSGLESKGLAFHLIGGADIASELDAKRAIAQGTRVASDL